MESSTGDPVLRSQTPFRRVAFIAALELESRLLQQTRLPGDPAVYTSGPGRQRSFDATRQAIAAGADAVVSWGVAGSLSPDAGTGSVILPATIKNGAGEWRTDDAWRNRLKLALAPYLEVSDRPLYTADRVVTTPADKSDLASRSGAVAVDMESSGLARAAADAGLPFVVLRVIADAAGDALPEAVESLVTADGKTRYRGLPAVLSSPRQISLLIRLARNSGQARTVLRRVVSILSESA